jgi:hypothetical protein
MSVIALAAVVATGCTANKTGSPSPTQGQATAQVPSTAGSATSATASLTGLNACSILTNAEAQQTIAGAGAGKDQGELGGSGTSNCIWVTPATNDHGSASFSITVRPNQGLDDVTASPGGQISTGQTTGGRKAKLLKNDEGEGSCALSIAVGRGRIDVNAATIRGTTDQMCSIVNKVSDAIEPKLPNP